MAIPPRTAKALFGPQRVTQHYGLSHVPRNKHDRFPWLDPGTNIRYTSWEVEEHPDTKVIGGLTPAQVQRLVHGVIILPKPDGQGGEVPAAIVHARTNVLKGLERRGLVRHVSGYGMSANATLTPFGVRIAQMLAT